MPLTSLPWTIMTPKDAEELSGKSTPSNLDRFLFEFQLAADDIANIQEFSMSTVSIIISETFYLSDYLDYR